MKLKPQQLTHSFSPENFDVNQSSDSKTFNQIPGQPRATKALEQGIHIPQSGYNLYLAGKSGTSRTRYVMNYLEPIATHGITPSDWLYVNNFDNPGEPRAIEMPPEQGISLIRDIDKLIEAVLATFPTVFENPSYLQQKTAAQKAFDHTYDQAVEVVDRAASARQIAVYRENSSITFTPLIDGQAADEAMFAQMTDPQREIFRQNVETLETLLNDSLLELPQWQRDFNDQLRELRTTTIQQSLKPLFEQLQQQYQGHAGIQFYLAQINNHLPRVIEEHFSESQNNQNDHPSTQRNLLESLYLPNLITRSVNNSGAPIVLETNPSYANLFGRLNYTSEQGSLSTSYRQIIAGSLHRANGGYLILDIEKVLRDTTTWEALKRSLRDGKIYIEPTANELQVGLPQLLKPESIPLNIKVILIGPRGIYYALERFDHDFDELFRVLVDFSDEIDSTTQNLQQFIQVVQNRAKQMNLAELSPCALSRLSEYACRVAENQHKLTACIDHIMEVVVEANHCLDQNKFHEIHAEDINCAIASRTQRNARLYEQLKEEIIKNCIVINTNGTAEGQVNGLSVIQVGESNFGCPVRITATAHPGTHGVVDIEREVELGQAVHSKGVLLLAGYLCGRYCKDFPLAISARIAMEQSYGYVEGDSASLAELCALLSALVSSPLRQDIAITGSVNQYGEVQAVGGINEKIEGFFELCKNRTLTGEQAVIIPDSNRSNLMLCDEVVKAVKNEQFSIYAVTSVDEALELLSGIEAGEENAKGKFPPSSFNGQVVKRLKQFTKFIQADKN
jgi:predicted ATP-dependent protease